MPPKAITAIICITAILITAMIMKIDGVLLAGGIATIAGLGGFALGRKNNP